MKDQDAKKRVDRFNIEKEGFVKSLNAGIAHLLLVSGRFVTFIPEDVHCGFDEKKWQILVHRFLGMDASDCQTVCREGWVMVYPAPQFEPDLRVGFFYCPPDPFDSQRLHPDDPRSGTPLQG